jgi:predicted MFS family arabinose efflux permease
MLDVDNLRQRWGTVALLTFVGILNIMDRFLPAILAQPIKDDLLLSDTAFGFINGFGFLIVYSVAGVPIARVTDRGRYGMVISCCIALWSVMTMLGGAAQQGWQLAVTRMGVALGETGTTPAAHAYISKNFPADRRAAPLALLTLSNPLAGMVGLLSGGILGQILGWRKTFLVMGATGIFLSLLVMATLGRRRAQYVTATDPATMSLRSTALLFMKRSFVLGVAATACIGAAGYSLTIFGPSFLMRAHGLSLSQVGINYGVTSGVTGSICLVVVGLVADRLSRTDARWLMWIVAGVIALALPFAIAMPFVSSAWATIACMTAANCVGMVYFVPIVAAIQRLTPLELRATASAVMLFFTALAGGAGPLVTGAISDTLEPKLGVLALGRALLFVPAVLAVGLILCMAAARTFLKDEAANATAIESLSQRFSDLGRPRLSR